jgi:3-hydroxyisobutyrate dehydrogenase
VPERPPDKEIAAMKIAVLGMGTMGAPMATNLLKAGCEVTVHNRTRSREEPLAELGAKRAETPAVAAAGVDIVLSCVSDTPDVEAVLLCPGHGHGVIHGLQEGGLVIDCSSIAPAATRDIAARFRGKGIGYVDAPVSGGSEGAIKGTLAIMCGGSEADFERAKPVLEVLGARITRIGEVGAGQIAKVANQVVIAGTFLALGEALTLAHRAGADPEKVVEAIGGGVAGSWILQNRSGNMLNGTYPLGFRTRLHRKDLGIALETARAFEVPVHIASLVATLEDGLIAQGYGDEDMSNLARCVRQGAGVPEGPMKG